MNVAEFDFELPAERIAQHPAPRRDESRLLVLDRETGALRHRQFSDLADLLVPGDLLVLNDTRVIPARLIGHKPSGGRVELLLIEPVESGITGGVWRCLLKASRPPAPGSSIDFGQGFGARVLERDPIGWRVRLEAPGNLPPCTLAHHARHLKSYREGRRGLGDRVSSGDTHWWRTSCELQRRVPDDAAEHDRRHI